MNENENTSIPDDDKPAMPVVVVLTPYRTIGKRKRTEYLRRAIEYTVMTRLETPVASHQMLAESDVLTAGEPDDDEIGIKAQRSLILAAERVVVYVDHGVSEGMTDGIEFARERGREVVFESIGQ